MKDTAIVLGVVLVISYVDASSQCTPHTFFGDAWDIQDPTCGSSCKEVQQFFWIKRALRDNYTRIAEEALNATSQMPFKKTLFDWGLHREIDKQPEDFLFPADQTACAPKYANWTGIWYDQGAVVVADLMEQLLSNYSKLEGPLDRFVVDAEMWFNNWVLFANPGPSEACKVQRGEYIEKDPRWPPLRQRLVSLGYQFGNQSLKDSMHNGENHVVFNSLMLNQSAKYFNRALWQPLQKYYPEAQLTNYRFELYNASKVPCVGDLNGDKYCARGTGALTGLTASPSLYMDPNGGLSEQIKKDFNVSSYPRTAFNAFKWAAYELRALTIGGLAPNEYSLTQDTSIRPWVAFRSYSLQKTNNSDYWNEAIFHFLLSGSDDLNYFNPASFVKPGDPSDAQFAATMREATAAIGCEERRWTFPDPRDPMVTRSEEMLPFRRPFVLTGMSGVGEDGGSDMFRLSTAGGPPEHFQTSSDPLTYRVPPSAPDGGGAGVACTVTFDKSARVFLPPASPVSKLGAWISQSGKAAAPTVQYDPESS